MSKSPEKDAGDAFARIAVAVEIQSRRVLMLALTSLSALSSMNSQSFNTTTSRVTRPLATAVRSVVYGVFLSKSKAAPGSARLTSAKIVSNETVDKARRNRGLMILASVRTPAPAATTAALAAGTSTVGHNLLVSYVQLAKLPKQ